MLSDLADHIMADQQSNAYGANPLDGGQSQASAIDFYATNKKENPYRDPDNDLLVYERDTVSKLD